MSNQNGILEYKCQRCQRVFEGGTAPDLQITLLHAMGVRISTISIEESMIRLKTIHECNPTQRGIANLIGGRIVEKKEGMIWLTHTIFSPLYSFLNSSSIQMYSSIVLSLIHLTNSLPSTVGLRLG